MVNDVVYKSQCKAPAKKSKTLTFSTMDVVYKVFIHAVDLSIFGHVLCGLYVEFMKCVQAVLFSK